MSNPVFLQSIAELTPIPVFIRRAGLGNLPLQLHLLTMALGALSFLVPLIWVVGIRTLRSRGNPSRGRPGRAGTQPRPTKAKEKRESRSKKANERRRANGSASRGPGRPESRETLATQPLPTAALRGLQST